MRRSCPSDISREQFAKIRRDLTEGKKVTHSGKYEMIIADSKSIQNADTAEEKGYDAGKTSGIKLHVGVDVLGLPRAVMATTANITDRSGTINNDFSRFYSFTPEKILNRSLEQSLNLWI